MHSTTHIKVKRFALYNISGRKLYNTKEAKEIYNHLKLQSDSHKKKKNLQSDGYVNSKLADIRFFSN